MPQSLHVIGNVTSGPAGDTSPIVGIDLGTTNSLVAYVPADSSTPVILSSREGKNLVPSVVTFVEGKPIVGYAAKRRKVREAENTVFSVKRLLGRGFEDLKGGAKALPYRIVPGEGILRIQVGSRVYTAIEISAAILRELKLNAEAALGVPVSRAVITVPAYFNDSQRQATRAAGRLAGFDVLRILNEPTAASLAYGLDKKKQGLIAVYDLGGGTFDLSILKLHDGIFEVLSTSGDSALGGDDLDQALAGVVIAEIQQKFGIEVRNDPQLHAAVLEAAEGAKITLATREKASLGLSLPNGAAYRREWTLAEFEALARPVLERTRQPCERALADAGVQTSDLSDVVLVGGPTRLKVVQQMAREIFGREPNTSVHPDEVVAAGAAIQADILAGRNKDFLLLDVVPLSLGIETYGGLTAPLIHRNTRIPTVAREGFTTFVDHQTAVNIHVLQGERERAEDNRSLARFKLRVPPMPAGMARVEVTFLIDADGILQVAAKDTHTGHEQSIEVRPSYGLTDAEVERMLMDSLENVQADNEVRQIIQKRNDAQALLQAAERRLNDAHRLLPKQDAEAIETNIAKLKRALEQDDLPAIHEASSLLNASTIRLAELLVKDALAKS